MRTTGCGSSSISVFHSKLVVDLLFQSRHQTLNLLEMIDSAVNVSCFQDAHHVC